MMCEGCGAKNANFGTPTERKHRWCGGCGKAHGAIYLATKMCEGCGAKQAGFGTPTERKRRWCSGCGKAHGAISLTTKMCEGCGAKQARFGTPTERKVRWCSGCDDKVHGAIYRKAFGTKRVRQGPPDNLSTSKSTMLKAGARADETAAGDATSLLLAMVKQELPSDATRQYYTLGSMCISTALV